MSNPWFRFYSAAIRHPKVAKLPDNDFRLWLNLLSVACENNGFIPPLDDLKHVLNARLDHLLRGIERLISALLIDRLEVGYTPHNWTKKQFISDTSTPRVTLHRKKHAVSETPPDTEQNRTDSDITKLLHSETVTSGVGLAGLELKLRKAAGWEQEPHPNLFVTGPIDALIKAGASLEQDILPVVSATASRASSRTTWNYFVPAIRRAWEARLSAGKPISGKSEIDAQAKKAAAQKFLDEHNAKFESRKNGPN
jgi:hypothetical protein